MLMKFNSSERSVEALMFLDDLDELEKKITLEDQEQLSCKIVSKYLETRSAFQVNLPGSTVKKILKHIEDKDVPIVDIYREAKVSLLITLEKDSFPRFVRSKEWRKHVLKRNLSYLQSIAQVRQAIEFPYSNEDFVAQVITDKDIQFLDQMSEDSFRWKLKGSNRNHLLNVFQYDSNIQLLPNVDMFAKSVPVRWTGTLQFPFETCVQAIVRTQTMHDSNVRTIGGLQYHSYKDLQKQYGTNEVNEPKRDVTVIYSTLGLPFPFYHKRYFILALTSIYFPETQSVVTYGKPCFDPKLDQLKVNATHLATMYRAEVRKIDDSTTFYSQVQVANIGGVAQKALKFVVMDRAVNMSKSFSRLLESEKFCLDSIYEDPQYQTLLASGYPDPNYKPALENNTNESTEQTQQL
jgi:hypothetical protein